MCEILDGCKACDMVDAPGDCSKKLFGQKGKVLFKILLGDGFTIGNHLVDVVVCECCWGGGPM